MKPVIFVHTNDKQMLGALVSQYSFKKFAKDPKSFDVKLIETRNCPWMDAREGQKYMRDGLQRTWLNDDLQSFTVLRFMPPELVKYKGRSVVVDPDVFCVSDAGPLLTRDMEGKAVMARKNTGVKSKAWATSVMLLDNEKLKHWNVHKSFDEMFEGKRDYMTWMNLEMEKQDTVGRLENVWNDFDNLTPETRFIHNTKRHTQPWKTGLPVDFRPPESATSLTPKNIYHRVRRALFGDYGMLGKYGAHPDKKQEQLFFALLRECIDTGTVTEAMVKDHMKHNHVRHDALEVLRKTPTLEERPLFAA